MKKEKGFISVKIFSKLRVGPEGVRPSLQGGGFYRCGLTRREGKGLEMRDLVESKKVRE
jgi:hypothetical protein